MKRRPSLRATTPVVPDPANGSHTISSISDPALMHISTRLSGKTAKCAPRNLPNGIFQTVLLFLPKDEMLDPNARHEDSNFPDFYLSLESLRVYQSALDRHAF